MIEQEIYRILLGLVNNRVVFEEDRTINLVEHGLIDSLVLIDLLSELEMLYDIELQPTTIDPECWRKLDTITTLVESKLNRIEI